MVKLRPMRVDDVDLIARWDEDPDVATALGGRGLDWYDWPTEVARDVPWRELLIAEEDGRAFGFVQLVDAVDDESHYWGEADPGTWAIDIWIGSPGDRGRGLGARAMQAAIARIFERHGARTVVIDPLVDNVRAIAFYTRVGFRAVGERDFDGDRCLVMRLERPATG
jgi:aminoglycoside 6'-N-acetyltransferase